MKSIFPQNIDIFFLLVFIVEDVNFDCSLILIKRPNFLLLEGFFIFHPEIGMLMIRCLVLATFISYTRQFMNLFNLKIYDLGLQEILC
jgi:hypothetical protein